MLASERFGCGREGLHFCVGGEVVQVLAEVVAPADDALAGDDEGADGDFVAGGSLFGFEEGEPHETLVKGGVHGAKVGHGGFS